MKKMIYLIPTIFLILLAILAVLSGISGKTPETGMFNGRLRPCPGTPNCVCSETKKSPFFIEPLNFTEPPLEAWDRAKGLLQSAGGRIEDEKEGYLRAVFATKIFRFRDDVELRMETERNLIHIRSSSRVGYSDFGQNRKRVEKIRSEFMHKQE